MTRATVPCGVLYFLSFSILSYASFKIDKILPKDLCKSGKILKNKAISPIFT